MPISGVTVVVPVYNPSHYIERTIASLLDQTLSRAHYEVVFVDDGSTDGTQDRLDELAAKHPDVVRVIHQPNSGGPGGPRNLGVERAVHNYVFFCDADDWLPTYALQTLLDRAEQDGSDVVIARNAGNRRVSPLSLYESGDYATTRRETPEIFSTLTCQKLFRRDFLRDGGIRFPEGKVRLEDYIFMTEAYLRAQRISILGSRPCYMFERRKDRGNITATRADAYARLASVEKMIDVVFAHTSVGPERDAALMRPIQSGLLRPVTVRHFLDLDTAQRAALVDRLADVLNARIPASALTRLDTRGQRIASAIGERDLGFLDECIRWESTLRATARVRTIGVVAGQLEVYLDVALANANGVQLLARRGTCVLAAHSANHEGYDVSAALSRTAVYFVLKGRASRETWRGEARVTVPTGAVRDDGVELRWLAQVTIDVSDFAEGQPLADGLWDAYVRISSCGLSRDTRVEQPGEDEVRLRSVPAAGSARPVRTQAGTLTVRVDGSVAPVRSEKGSSNGGTARRRRARGLARRLRVTVTSLLPGTVAVSTRPKPPRVLPLIGQVSVVAQGRDAHRVTAKRLDRRMWLVRAPGAALDKVEIDVERVAKDNWLVAPRPSSPWAELVRETDQLRHSGTRHIAWLLRRYNINCVLDVGANKGQYATLLREGGYTGRIVSFEPVPEFAEAAAARAAADDAWVVRHLALGQSAGMVPIRVQRSFSSLLDASEYGRARFRRLHESENAEPVDVPLQRLDAVLDDELAPLIEQGIEPRIYLKMDTQGFDLEVFRGLGERGREIIAMQSELALLPIYEQMPLMADALAVYQAAGFEVTGLYPVTRERDGRVIEYDCTMVRADAFPRVRKR